MPKVTESELRKLRTKYQAAYAEYQSCAAALAKLDTEGERRPKVLITKEAKALEKLSVARTKYRAALFECAFGIDDAST